MICFWKDLELVGPEIILFGFIDHLKLVYWGRVGMQRLMKTLHPQSMILHSSSP